MKNWSSCCTSFYHAVTSSVSILPFWMPCTFIEQPHILQCALTNLVNATGSWSCSGRKPKAGLLTILHSSILFLFWQSLLKWGEFLNGSAGGGLLITIATSRLCNSIPWARAVAWWHSTGSRGEACRGLCVGGGGGRGDGHDVHRSMFPAPTAFWVSTRSSMRMQYLQCTTVHAQCWTRPIIV